MSTQQTQVLTPPQERVITPSPDTDQATTETQPDQGGPSTPGGDQPSGPSRGRRAAIAIAVVAVVAVVAAIAVAIVVDFGGSQTTTQVAPRDTAQGEPLTTTDLVNRGLIPEQTLQSIAESDVLVDLVNRGLIPEQTLQSIAEAAVLADLVNRGLVPAQALVPVIDVSGSDAHLYNLVPTVDVSGSDAHLYNLAQTEDVSGSDAHLYNLAPTVDVTGSDVHLHNQAPVPPSQQDETAALQAEKGIVLAGAEVPTDPVRDDSSQLQAEKEAATQADRSPATAATNQVEGSDQRLRNQAAVLAGVAASQQDDAARDDQADPEGLQGRAAQYEAERAARANEAATTRLRGQADQYEAQRAARANQAATARLQGQFGRSSEIATTPDPDAALRAEKEQLTATDESTSAGPPTLADEVAALAGEKELFRST